MWLDGWFGKQAPDRGQPNREQPGREQSGRVQPDRGQRDADAPAVSLKRGRDGRLHPGQLDEDPPSFTPRQDVKDKKLTDKPKTVAEGNTAPDTSALNQQIVQAVQFSNTETADYAGEMVATPPEIMVSTTTGMAVQDAKNYMNAIMQIAVAAQAVAIKKAAEGPEPVSALKEVPLLAEIQNMVTQAVSIYGTVSTTAGTSASTVIGDLKAED